MKKIKLAIFASGSGSNAENIAEYFHSDSPAVVNKIYCNNPQAFVLERAKRQNIPVRVFSRKEFYESDVLLHELKAEGTDYIILAGFLWLIPIYLIRAFPDKIINIHPALLPAYGGKGMYGHHVHEAVVKNAEKETGITIHLVNEEYDKGLILAQHKCPVLPNDTPEDVAKSVHRLEFAFFPKTIESYISQTL